MGHEVTREYLFKPFIIRVCKGTVATCLTLTVAISGDRNILLSFLSSDIAMFPAVLDQDRGDHGFPVVC